MQNIIRNAYQRYEYYKFSFLKPLFVLFSQNNFELNLVGGCVRDYLTFNDIKDFDFNTNAKPEQIKEVLSNSGLNVRFIEKNGGNFGTVAFIFENTDLEITTYRKDVDYPTENDRRPIVEFSDSLEEDLMRRDFTINTIYMDYEYFKQIDNLIEQDKIVNIYEFNERYFVDQPGYYDLKNRELISPQDPETLFKDDPLRILRAYRFATKYNLEIHSEVRQALRNNSHRISLLSRERVREELCKIAGTKNPHISFRLMMEDGIWRNIFPELVKQLGFNQKTKYHHLPLWEHTLKVVENTYSTYTNQGILESDYCLILSALLHDYGKTFCLKYHYDKDGINKETESSDCFYLPEKIEHYTDLRKITFRGHEEAGANYLKKILSYWTFSNKDIELITKMVAEHGNVHENQNGVYTDKMVRKFVNDWGKPEPYNSQSFKFLSLLYGDRLSVAENYNTVKPLDDLYKRSLELDTDTLVMPVNGNDVMELTGLKPGKELGTVMKEIKRLVIEGEITSKLDVVRFLKSIQYNNEYKV